MRETGPKHSAKVFGVCDEVLDRRAEQGRRRGAVRLLAPFDDDLDIRASPQRLEPLLVGIVDPIVEKPGGRLRADRGPDAITIEDPCG